ncbi:MAG: N-acetyltransferase family protein [Sphingobacteriales bacterium]
MHKIKIKEATNGDAALIADMSRHTFYDTFAPVNAKEDMDKFMNEQFTREALMKEVEDRDGIFFLAYYGDEAVGYVRMREGENRNEFNNKPSVEIARIYAVQSAIGKGVGKALMQHCIEAAIKMNKAIIWLGVWEKNERAIAFYSKWGFEKFAEHDFVLGNDLQTDWLMMRKLTG